MYVEIAARLINRNNFLFRERMTYVEDLFSFNIFRNIVPTVSKRNKQFCSVAWAC